MSFLLRALYQSLYSTDFYREVAFRQRGIGFKFVLFLSIIPAIVLIAGLWIAFLSLDEDDVDRLIDELPNFVLTAEGEVQMDRQSPFILGDEKDGMLVVDTENYNELPTDELFALMEKQNIQLLVTRDKIIMNEEDRNQYRIFDLSEKRDEDLVLGHQEMKDFFYIIGQIMIPIIGLLFFAFYLSYRIIQLLLYGISGIIISKIMRSKLEYPDILRLSAYAIWPSILLSIIITALDIQAMTAVSIVTVLMYQFFAISAVKKGE